MAVATNAGIPFYSADTPLANLNTPARQMSTTISRSTTRPTLPSLANLSVSVASPPPPKHYHANSSNTS